MSSSTNLKTFTCFCETHVRDGNNYSTTLFIDSPSWGLAKVMAREICRKEHVRQGKQSGVWAVTVSGACNQTGEDAWK